MVCRSEFLQRRYVVDCNQASALIEGFLAQYLLADRGYDTNAIVERVISADMEAVIPSKHNRKEQRDYD